MNQPFAIVTGASRGIGRAIAIGLAKSGFNLALNFARNLEAAIEAKNLCIRSALAAGHSIQATLIQADISNPSERAQLMLQAKQCSNQLNLLVNNAGIAPAVRADLLDATEESFDTLINCNLKAPYFITQSASKWMLESFGTMTTQYCNESGTGPAPSTGCPDPRFAPKIITISSISAYTASVNRGDYCVSKAGLSMMTALFAERLASAGIQVHEIRPGIIATDMTQGVREKYDRLIQQGLTPIQRWGTPEDVAKAVVAIASGAFPFSTGQVHNVDGGFHMRRL